MTKTRKEILSKDKTVKLLASENAHERIYSHSNKYGRKKLEALIRQAYQHGYAAGQKNIIDDIWNSNHQPIRETK